MEQVNTEQLMVDHCHSNGPEPLAEDGQSPHLSSSGDRLLTLNESCVDAKRSAGLNLISQFLSSQESSDDESDSSSDESATLLSDIELSDLKDELPNSVRSCPRVKGEVDYRELPSENDCNIPFPVEGKILPIGEVVHYTEKLVVIKSLPNTPTINEGTILWRHDKTSIAKVFETFGPVKSPFYSILVQSSDEVHQLGLNPGDIVYVVPGDLDLTTYVFTTKLLAERGCDASGKNDQEVPVECQEFSDDDEELLLRKKIKGKGKQRNEEGKVSVQEQDMNCTEYQSIPFPNNAPPVQLLRRLGPHPFLCPPSVFPIPPNPSFHPYSVPPPPPFLYPPPWPGYPPPFH